MCSVWLFWLNYQYLPSDWLERFLWGSLIVAIVSPESPCRRVCVIFLVHCIASLFHYVLVLSPAPMWYNYFPTFMAWYSLFVRKVPLNPKQTNKQNIQLFECLWWFPRKLLSDCWLYKLNLWNGSKMSVMYFKTTISASTGLSEEISYPLLDIVYCTMKHNRMHRLYKQH